MSIQRKIIRVQRLDEQGKDDELLEFTPEERIQMVWQITMDTWAFTGEKVAQSRLPRHIVRVLRP